MFIPLHDLDNRHRRVVQPYVTYVILGVNVAVWALLNLLPVGIGEGLLLSFAMMPSGVALQAREIAVGFLGFQLPEVVTAITSAFIHVDFFHILGNMAFLWVFADNVEDAMGHARFIAFYLLCALAAGLLQGAVTPDSVLYGASGAVAGVVAAYLMLHPNVRLRVLVLKRIPVVLAAFWVIGAWILFQLVMAAADDGTSGVGWYAHIGGLMAGAVLIPFFKHKDVPLFEVRP